MSAKLSTFALLAALVCTCAQTAAQNQAAPASQDPAAPSAEAMSAADAVKKRLDPTDFQTRVESRYEHQALHDGGSRAVFVPRLEYAFTNTLALRIETPYVWNRADGQPYDRGFGDVTARLNWRALRKPGFALVIGPEISFDTGEEGLGADMTIFQPVVFAAVDLPSFNSVFFPFAQHFVDIAGDNDVNMSLFRTALLTRWPNRFYTFFEPSLYVNWRDDNKTASSFELEVGRVMTRHLALWVRPGVGFGGNRLPFVPDWNIEVGFRYFLD